ncbi:inosine/xanthosine triphosphatase [Halorientalis sp.]|jgi:inosine/xanthosine triphosphatase|uniref:inosine/xanthosine triphosphatase n=1 Tax=Halorientalis sp. TaxID=1931229 RepID=UPI00262AC4B2|nr:inosine/xanthosine triphosphatase [Halorientalis sp.]
MRVAVGSENPVKVAATERTLPDAVAEPVDVESGVPEQPRGYDQTIAGARNRAGDALAATDVALGVGIEGGVARIEGTDGLFLIMWAAVTDGTDWGVGSGPSLRLPENVATRVEAGAELGPVMDDLLDTDGVAEREGAAGVLTGKRIDRESAVVHAVASAAGPFVTEQY